MAKVSTRIGGSKVLELYVKQKGKCFYCPKDIYDGIFIHYSIDHKLPVSRGGKKILENLCLACPDCNSLKSSMTDKEFKVALDLLEQGQVTLKKLRRYSNDILLKYTLSPK